MPSASLNESAAPDAGKHLAAHILEFRERAVSPVEEILLRHSCAIADAVRPACHLPHRSAWQTCSAF
jgi:hypothetical protein